MCRTTIRRGAGKRRVDGKSLRLADEVRYIQQCAADHDGRVVTVGQVVPSNRDLAMPGCWTLPISLLQGWPVMGICG